MVNSRLTLEIEREIITSLLTFYNQTIAQISDLYGLSNVGGKIRKLMGDLGEAIAEIAWIKVATLYEDIQKPIKPIKGEKDKKLCTNSKGHTYMAHVDKHCYIASNFILAIESKSYLDSCYYARASNDFRLLKQYFNKKLICIIVSIEDAASETSKEFIEDEGWVNKTFILTNGKRSSSKPIWNKQFKKDLEYEKVLQLVRYIDGIFCSLL